MLHKINWRFWRQFPSFSQEIGVHILFNLFFGVFAKLQKAAINFVMSVCLSIHPHGMTQLTLDGFSWNYIFEYFFRKSFEKIQVSLKSDRIMGTLGEDQYKFLIISHSILLRLRSVSGRTFKEIKMHNWCSITSPLKKKVALWDVEKYYKSRQATNDSMARAVHDHTLYLECPDVLCTVGETS
jgi:hypothetical protein